MKHKYLRAFVAGSSFPVVITPLVYMGTAIILNPNSGFNYFTEVITIPILFGLLNMLFIKIRAHIPCEWIKKYLAFGAFHWVFFSFLWNFWLNVPEELFMLSGWFQYLTIPVAIVLYACIWRFIMSKMNAIVWLEK